jgi:hypothetical protein
MDDEMMFLLTHSILFTVGYDFSLIRLEGPLNVWFWWFDDGDINDVLGMYNLTNVYCLVLGCVTKGMVQVKTEW